MSHASSKVCRSAWSAWSEKGSSSSSIHEPKGMLEVMISPGVRPSSPYKIFSVPASSAQLRLYKFFSVLAGANGTEPSSPAAQHQTKLSLQIFFSPSFERSASTLQIFFSAGWRQRNRAKLPSCPQLRAPGELGLVLGTEKIL